MPKCGFILIVISMKIAKVRTSRLARFALWNSPAWLKTRCDGVDVAVIPRSSRAAAFRYDKGNDVRFSNTHNRGSQPGVHVGLHLVVHLSIRRGTFEDSNRKEKYIIIIINFQTFILISANVICQKYCILIVKYIYD